MKQIFITVSQVLVASTVFGQTLINITDTFDDEVVGGTLYQNASTAKTTTGGSMWESDDKGGQTPTFVDRGGGNIAIQINKSGGTRENAFRIPSMTSGFLSFDFNFIQDGLDQTTVKDSFTMRLSTASNLGNSNPHSSAFIDRSALGLELNSWHNVKLFFNASSEVFNYDTTDLTDTDRVGGFGEIAMGKLDVFIDGNLIRDEESGSSEALDYAGFVIYKSATQNLITQYDNFEIIGIGIPEPHTYGLLVGLISFCGLFIFKHRSH